MTFKHELPEDCPDETVSTLEMDITCFHLTKEHPAGKNDFIPIAMQRVVKEDELCQGSGLSVSENIEDIRWVADTFPKHGKYIWKGTIRYMSDGIVKLTPSRQQPAHHTWYPFEGTTISNIFNDLEEIYEKKY